MKVEVIRYRNQKSYQRDANKRAKKGWAVVSVTSEQPRSGCGRVFALGLFAIIFKPKPVLVVTYQRA